MSSLRKQPVLNQKPQWRETLSEYITAIAWSSDGIALAVATAAGEVVLYPEAALTGKKAITLQSTTDTSIECLGFSANGQWLVAAGQNGQINLWDTTQALANPTDKPTLSLDQGDAWIDRLVWHPTRSEFAFSLGKYVQVWSAETQDIVTTLNFDASTVLALNWHPSGEWLTVGGYQGIKLWSTADWYDDPIHFEMATATAVMAWDSSGKYLAANTLDKTVMLLQWLGEDFDSSPWHMQGFPGKVRACTWSHAIDAEPLLVTSSSAEVVVWRRKTTPEVNWEGEVLAGHLSNVNSLAFQPHRDVLASAAADGKVSLWCKAATWEQTLDTSKSEVTCLQWQLQGQRLAVGNADGSISVWTEFTQAKGFGGR